MKKDEILYIFHKFWKRKKAKRSGKFSVLHKKMRKKEKKYRHFSQNDERIFQKVKKYLDFLTKNANKGLTF